MCILKIINYSNTAVPIKNLRVSFFLAILNAAFVVIGCLNFLLSVNDRIIAFQVFPVLCLQIFSAIREPALTMKLHKHLRCTHR